MNERLTHRHPRVWITLGSKPILNNLPSYPCLVIALESQNHFLNGDMTEKIRPCKVQIFTHSHTRAFEFPAKMVLLTRRNIEQERISFLNRMQADTSHSDLISPADLQEYSLSIALSLGSRNAYDEIASLFESSLARQLLLAANELAALNHWNPKSKVLRQVRASKAGLWSQFFRESEERFALIEFPRIMKNFRPHSRLLSNAESIHANVPLWNGAFELPLRLSFPTVLGQRQLQNVIIGPNGSGKSNLLLGLAQSVIDNYVQIETPVNTPIDAYTDQQRPPIPIVVFTYEKSMWSRLSKENLEIYEQGVQSSNWRQLTQIIYDLAEDRDNKDPAIDLRLLMEVLSGFVNVQDIHIPLHPQQDENDGSNTDNSLLEIALMTLVDCSPKKFRNFISRLDRAKPPVMRSSNGTTYSLSSGERSLTIFCSRLMSSSLRSALILIDEPENHLHPRFITLMIQALASSLQATGSRALMVTHSPFVVREFERSTVKVMRRNANGTPELLRPSMQTLGGDVSMISDYVFEDVEIRKGFELSIDQAIRAQQFHEREVDAQTLTERLGTGLGEDAISYLIAQSEAATKRMPDA